MEELKKKAFTKWLPQTFPTSLTVAGRSVQLHDVGYFEGNVA
jgi:hypothetical protein